MNNFIENNLLKLKQYNFLNPEIELRAILNFSSTKNEDIIISNFDIQQINVDTFNLIFQRRIGGEPFSKIIHSKEFYGYGFFVNNHVLDPRPETELLIDTAIKYFPNLNMHLKICDLGTGSGCLAIVLAKIYKNSKITATDISFNAINVAKQNAIKHDVCNKINFIHCDWIDHIKKFDLIVSNPPYLSLKEYQNCSNEIRYYEPRIALEAGYNGLAAYKKLALIGPQLMSSKSFFLIEIGYNQKKAIIKIFNECNIESLEIIKDYQLIDRILIMKKIQKKIK